jgi:hypothetical protein
MLFMGELIGRGIFFVDLVRKDGTRKAQFY